MSLEVGKTLINFSGNQSAVVDGYYVYNPYYERHRQRYYTTPEVVNKSYFKELDTICNYCCYEVDGVIFRKDHPIAQDLVAYAEKHGHMKVVLI